MWFSPFYSNHADGALPVIQSCLCLVTLMSGGKLGNLILRIVFRLIVIPFRLGAYTTRDPLYAHLHTREIASLILVSALMPCDPFSYVILQWGNGHIFWGHCQPAAGVWALYTLLSLSLEFYHAGKNRGGLKR